MEEGVDDNYVGNGAEGLAAGHVENLLINNFLSGGGAYNEPVLPHPWRWSKSKSMWKHELLEVYYDLAENLKS